MTTTTTATTTSRPRDIPGPLTTLARMELLLLRRNWTAATLGVVTPLVFGFLLARAFGDDPANRVAGVTAALAMAGVFSVHYHLTAVYATRRQEGVLKRLRAGVLDDRRILVGTALGGLAVFGVQLLVLVGFGVLVLGLPVPAHPITMLLGVVPAAVVLAALAAALSGLTRSSEAAMLTTLPTMTLFLATPGVLLPAAHVGPLPYTIGWFTPLGAATELMRDGWLGTSAGVPVSAAKAATKRRRTRSARPGVAAA
jgi:ABC-2 type transport system permease protein